MVAIKQRQPPMATERNEMQITFSAVSFQMSRHPSRNAHPFLQKGWGTLVSSPHGELRKWYPFLVPLRQAEKLRESNAPPARQYGVVVLCRFGRRICCWGSCQWGNDYRDLPDLRNHLRHGGWFSPGGRIWSDRAWSRCGRGRIGRHEERHDICQCWPSCRRRRRRCFVGNQLQTHYRWQTL